MSAILLGFREVRRAKVRFGLLSLAVGVLVFVVLFQQALLDALVGQFVGGIERQSAEVLVYGDDARRNLPGSVVDPGAVDAVGGVEGVDRTGPLGVATFTVRVDDREQTDATLIGHRIGGPGRPTSVDEGRQAEGPGEAVASGDEEEGYALGAQVVVEPSGRVVEVVGLASGAQLNVTPTLFVPYERWEAERLAANPAAREVAPSAVAVAIDPDADPVEVARRITAEVDGVEALDRDRAADESPGVQSISQSLALILVLTVVVVVLVVGFFFLILTVQKRASLTLLRALGAPARRLVLALLTQVLLVVAGGIAFGAALAAAGLAAIDLLDASLEPGPVVGVAVVIMAFSLVASAGAVRRVLRIQPVDATLPGGVGS